MNSVEFVLPSDPIDLTNCDREPIHIPGAIQPHGYLLAFDAARNVISVSSNLCALLAADPSAILGRPVSAFDRRLAALTDLDVGSKAIIELGDAPFVARRMAVGGNSIIEFEPSPNEDEATVVFSMFHQAALGLVKQKSISDIVTELPKLVRAMTGFDRTMVYRFDRDWHGAIVGEDKIPRLEPFLGLNYPATDIPVQARELYKRNLVRLIADIDYKPAGLIGLAEAPPLDLSDCNVRSVSPMHVQYLKNMGVQATLTISLMVHGELWGLIACHHYSGPRYLGIQTRKMCETIASIASFAIASLMELDRRRLLAERNALIDAFFTSFRESNSFSGTISKRETEFLQMTDACGAALFSRDRVEAWGVRPPLDSLASLARWVSSRVDEKGVFLSDCLEDFCRESGTACDQASGVFAIKVPDVSSADGREAIVMWFRPEHITTVNWGGDPRKALQADASGHVLSPRRSFSKWTEIRKGRAVAWTDMDLTVVMRFRSLCRDVVVERARERAHQADLRLAHLERLSALGELTAGIAHDFNNTLLGIHGSAEILARASDLGAAHSAGKRIAGYCNRGASLVKGLLKHSRSDGRGFEPVDARELFLELVAFSRALPGDSIEVEARDELGGISAHFNGSSNEILQTLLNIVKNAREAFGGKAGRVVISLRSGPDLGQVTFAVEDNAGGIPPQILDQIFDPFFTTKEVGAGTGLGLSSAKQIMMIHRGLIQVDSEVGRGAIFSVTLPTIDAVCVTDPVEIAPVSDASRESRSPLALADLDVLLVEDDPDNREMMEELLGGSFKSLRTAPDGLAALNVIADAHIDLVISDLRMPNMDGMSLYREIRKRLPGTPFVLSTGELLSREQLIGHVADPLFALMIKPFKLDTLLASALNVAKEAKSLQ